MRVISGSYRGAKLSMPEDLDIRPTLDRVKQAVFNAIQFKVNSADVLDLFAGTGALGIEAVSRGANTVVFNDNAQKACSLIEENCLKFKFKPVLYNYGYDFLLKKFIEENKKFDIIFIDPPYKSKDGVKAVEIITGGGLLNKGGVAVFEHTGSIKTDGLPEEKFKVKSKKYGIVIVDFIYSI